MLRYMILGLLRGDERIHGYALWKAYERRSGHVVQNGKFYRTLKSLADGGLIRPMAPPDSDPRRTPYEITTAGSAAFDQWIVAFDGGHGPTEDEISSRALFVLELPADVARPFFLGVEDVLSARWKRIEHERERMLSRPGISDRDRLVQSLLLTRNLERASADLSWLREARAAYTQFHGAHPSVGSALAPPARRRAGGRTQQ